MVGDSTNTPKLILIDEQRYHPHPKFMPYPAQHVAIRGVDEERYTLLDVTQFNEGGPARIVEEIEVSRALFEAFEGAVVSPSANLQQVFLNPRSSFIKV